MWSDYTKSVLELSRQSKLWKDNVNSLNDGSRKFRPRYNSASSKLSFEQVCLLQDGVINLSRSDQSI
jgi:hypothetical protein